MLCVAIASKPVLPSSPPSGTVDSADSLQNEFTASTVVSSGPKSVFSPLHVHLRVPIDESLLTEKDSKHRKRGRSSLAWPTGPPVQVGACLIFFFSIHSREGMICCRSDAKHGARTQAVVTRNTSRNTIVTNL